MLINPAIMLLFVAHYLCLLCKCYYAFTQGKWLVRTGIGRTQPALDRRRTCTVCALFQSVCVLFQSVLGTLWQWEHSLNVFPIRTEMVRKWTETVRKRCKYGIRLARAGWVRPMPVCTGHFPCVRYDEYSLQIIVNTPGHPQAAYFSVFFVLSKRNHQLSHPRSQSGLSEQPCSFCKWKLHIHSNTLCSI